MDLEERLSLLEHFLNESALLIALNRTENINPLTPVLLNVSSSKDNPISPTKTYLYCGEELEKFSKSYKLVHGYISLFVCFFGAVANILNIVVLTRMHKQINPNNAILIGLAIADLLVMMEYIPFAMHMYILNERPVYERFNYPWAIFVLTHAHLTQVLHTISIWLTLLLAVWRYISVAHPLKSRLWCTLNRALLAIILAYICCPLLCFPIFLTYTIQEQRWRPDHVSQLELIQKMMNNTSTDVPKVERMLYFLGTSQLAKSNDSLLQSINFWTYSVVIKLIPCLALTILSLQLIKALTSVNTRRESLMNRSSSRRSDSSNNNSQSNARKNDRTTRMMLAVLFLFLFTEFPQGILALLSGILGDVFFTNCYTQLGELMDILALINGATNFILYFFMNSQFRETFFRLFGRRGDSSATS